MKEYLVTWVIVVDAESPEDAAREAHKVMLDPSSTALVFEVVEADDVHGAPVEVDLGDLHEASHGVK